MQLQTRLARDESFFVFFFFFERERERESRSCILLLALLKRRDFKLCVLNETVSLVNFFFHPILIIIVFWTRIFGKRGGEGRCFLEKYSRFGGEWLFGSMRNWGKGREGARWTTQAVRFWIYSVPPPLSRRDLAGRCLNRARTIRFPGVNKIVPLPHFRGIVHSLLYIYWNWNYCSGY